MSKTTATKPRVRINTTGLITSVNGKTFTGDSFQNFAASVGIGTGNLTTASNYGLNPISRNHTVLEWMYRGSWIVRKIIDVVAEDMTRAKIQVTSEESPEDLQKLDQYWSRLLLWNRLCQTIKWARLYGGCLAVIMIDGQNPEIPLTVESVGKGQFKGLLVLDRWMVWANLENPVTDFGVDFGTPKFYTTNSDASSIPSMKIHHSRCIRIDGIELPYWQRMAENGWGLSVIEPLYDRLVAFDSTTQGAAQLLYKAHLRTYYVERLREIIATGGKTYQALLQQVNMIRLMQTNEGMSLFDSTDRFETHSYSFAGISDILVQFSQQLSGAADIPLTRLFGQAPAGMNATGESDMRNYYDMINAQQETSLRRGVETLRSLTYRSLFGRAPKIGETFMFTNLWKMSDAEKASVADSILKTAAAGVDSQIMTREAAMKEVKQWATVTGFGNHITEKDIKSAHEDEPPTLGELTGGRIDNPIDEIKFRHGLPSDDQNDKAEQLGEEQVTGGEESGQGIPGVTPATNPSTAPEVAPAPRDNATVRDRRSVIEIHGLIVVVETAKGEQRSGPGWRVSMPADYGYISGTSSAEGPTEQMDCYVGPDIKSQKIWVIRQNDLKTGEFDEHKVMLGFNSEQKAISTYCEAFSDGSGKERIDDVTEMPVDKFKQWLAEWQYGLPGKIYDKD